MIKNKNTRYLKVKEVADRLRLSTSTIYRNIHDGNLKAKKIGIRSYRIKDSDFVLFSSGKYIPKEKIQEHELSDYSLRELMEKILEFIQK